MKYAVVLGLLVAAAWGWGCHMKQVGELNGKIANLVRSRERADSTYRVEVSEMANQMLHYKNLRRTVRITDTVWVKQFIVAADSTIAACTDVVTTCEKRVAIADSTIKALKKKPSVWGKIPWILGGVVAGKLILK